MPTDSFLNDFLMLSWDGNFSSRWFPSAQCQGRLISSSKRRRSMRLFWNSKTLVQYVCVNSENPRSDADYEKGKQLRDIPLIFMGHDLGGCLIKQVRLLEQDG